MSRAFRPRRCAPRRRVTTWPLHTEKYKTGTVAYTTFPGRPHFPGVSGWEEVADYALQWATEHSRNRYRVEAGSASPS